MRNLRFMIARNLILFWKNKINVLLSFFSIVVVMSLYFIFLRDFVITTAITNGVSDTFANLFSDRFMVAGLLIVANTTTCFGVIQNMVKDKETGRRKDFMAAPVDSMTMALGYWFSAAIVSAIYTIMTFLLYEGYFAITYGDTLSVMQSMRIIGTIVTSSVVNAGILYILSYLIHNTTDFSTFANLYGTIIGFLAGAYLPYFFYGGMLKKVLYYLPCTQLTSLIRQLYTDELSDRLLMVQGKEMYKEIEKIFGIVFFHGREEISSRQQWSIIVIGLAVILSIITIIETIKDGMKGK